MRISDWSSDVCSSDLPCSKRPRHIIEPGPGLPFEPGADPFANLRMIVVDPRPFGRGHRLHVDQLAVDRSQSERLETQHFAFRARYFSRLYQHQIFYTDAIFSGLVIARLVGKEHTRLQRPVPAAAGG